MGTDSKYSPLYCELIKELMSEGASIEEVAAAIGVVKQTLYNWCKEHPEFLDSKEIGEQLSRGWWYKQGRIALRDKEFSPALFNINMKNRFGWTDKQEINQNNTGVPQIVVTKNYLKPKDVSDE